MNKLLLFGCVVALAAVASADGAVSATFGGVDVPVETCRVSAFPMNRIWPGRQRPLSQTKTAWFVSFDVAAAGELVVRLPEAAGAVRVHPFRRGGWRVADGVFHARVEHPEQFVIKSGETEVHVFADAPWKYERRPGDRYFGPGVHEAGAIVPKSGERIVLDRGATVYGNIVLLGVTNVVVEGRGILDTSRIKREDPAWAGVRAAEECRIAGVQPVWGTAPVYAYRCGNISISGIVFRDAPRWTMNICDSCDILIDGVKLVGMWRYNADGIDLCACERSVIRNSFIRSFDDCVIARPQLHPDEVTQMRDMMVSNCVLWCDWGVNMKVQHGQRACEMSDIHFQDIDCLNVDMTPAVVTTRWGSSGSVIRNVSFDDIRIDVPEDRVCQQFQRAEDETFRPIRAKSLSLAIVGCYSMGRPAANQGQPGKMDPNFFRLDYSGIAFRNFTVYDRPGHRLPADAPLECRVDVATPLPHFAVRDLEISALPPQTHINTSGNVRFAEKASQKKSK